MRRLGNSGLFVSELAFGTMTFGGRHGYEHVGTASVAEATELVGMCLDVGVNYFDTADTYSGGRSEEVLGAALGRRRADVIVATTVRWAVPGQPGGPNDQGLSRHHILRAVEGSLRRLGTDYIDLYQVQGWDGRTPWEETLRALDDLVRAGKVRYLGASNLSAWQLTQALGVSERRMLERFIVHQVQYNLVSREVEWELLEMAEAEGVGITCWSPLAGGFLAGQQQRGQGAPRGTRRALGHFDPADETQAFDALDVTREIAGKRGVSPAQVAIRWLLERPQVSSVIIGARNAAQLADNLGALTWELDDDQRAILDVVTEPMLPYPFWHQRMAGAALPGRAVHG
ncbi:aldo/keto reductase [Micromonospora sp. NPDC047557]|uniref:aldo/keto reductase n=1 Tax=Micromonospora sp. NPDC047557 TaxID=3364250 RepID=UPI003719CAC6